LPTKRRVYAYEGDYELVKEPLLVKIDMAKITLVSPRSLAFDPIHFALRRTRPQVGLPQWEYLRLTLSCLICREIADVSTGM
jgi:hypothetical protein